MENISRKILWFMVLVLLSQNASAQSADTSIPFYFPRWEEPSFKKQVFDIRSYTGNKVDKEGYITKAIARAIEDCHQSGGGIVLIPEGVWLTGPIHLKSNVNLHIEEDAEVRFSQNFEDYLPVVLIQRGGFFCYNYSPMIYAKDCENIAITGKGTLNGQGQVWWPWKNKQPGMTELFKMGKSRVPIKERVFGTEDDGVRPPFIQFLECKNILLEGFTMRDGSSWNLHPVFCENLIVRGISIISHGPNNDGIDPDGCKNVLIEDCFLDVGDDAICIKSGRDEEAWEIGRPSENIVVRGCHVLSGHGGFVIGSEMSAGVKNVLVEDCDFSGTDRGIRFKSRLGRGGVVENVWVRNIRMDSIKNEAIVFNLLYDSEPIEREMAYNRRTRNQLNDAPVFRKFHLKNIECKKAKTAIKIQGLPGGQFLSDIELKDIKINSFQGVICSNANEIVFENNNIESENGMNYHLEDCQNINISEEVKRGEEFISISGLIQGVQVNYKGKKPSINFRDDLMKQEVKIQLWE
ncbi:glycoside hydrolase family 28 protein [uncultured Arcticibacterium sp.]|uniref:glycoside hydrolase family 28 protein n=1 Tax=uncultured Arcticibacterium sp. TaxID=2173042 RepID=UPI0030F95332